MADEKSLAPAVAFFDVDGTLVDRSGGLEGHPTPRVVEAIRAFVDAGNVAVVCTGRSVLGIAELCELVPFGGKVTINGTHVELGDRVILDRVIEPEVFSRTIDEMRRIGMKGLIEGTYGVVRTDYGPGELDYLPLPTFEEYRDAGGVMEFGKIDFTDAGLAALEKSPWLREHFDYLNVGEGYHELAIPGTSKADGARALIDALPFVPSRTYAFGDSENDLSILDFADYAVVMGNAHDSVKAHADYVCEPVGEDGVALALEHLGLI